MTDVTFINVNRWYSPIIPIGICIMSACLKSAGYTTKIIDPKHKDNEEYILRKIKQQKPKVIGMTVYTNDVYDCIKLSKKIKEQNPDITIIAGGSHATIKPQEILDYGIADYVFTGEAEHNIIKFMKKQPKNKIIKQEQPIENINEIPMPDYENLNMKHYTFPNAVKIRGIMLSAICIYTSRGCPYRCTYCSSHLMFGRKTRFRSPEKIVDEIELLKKKYSIDGFYILDDSFTVNKKHVEGICKELIERKLNLIWGCETRVNIINEEKLKIMKKAGCVQIDFGVESGSQKILNTLKKDITIQQIYRAFKLCKKHKIRTFANFMVNNPDETWADILQTWNMAKKLKPNCIGIWVTTPYPATELYDQFKINHMALEDYMRLGYGDTRKYNQQSFKNRDMFKITAKMQKALLKYRRINSILPFINNKKYIKLLLNNKSLYVKALLKR